MWVFSVGQPPGEEEEVEEAFCSRLKAASRSQALGLTGGFTPCYLLGRPRSPGGSCRAWMRTLVEEPRRRGGLLDLVLTNRAGQGEDVEVGG